MRRRPFVGLAVVSIALAIVSPACGMKKQPAGLSEASAISIDPASLWSPEAATEPIAAYKVRLASDPYNAGLHNNLGNAYVHENFMDLAIEEYKTASRLDPTSPIPWNNIGIVFKKQGRLSDARSAFERAIEIDDRYALAWYNLGTVYDDEGNYDRAIELYLEALARKPELGKVEFNPQIVNNRNLMVVQLRHFLEESGNIALPLDRLSE